MICIILQKLLWKFYQHPRLGTLSRLLLSSKSLPGVMEDKEVPDERGVGVRYQRSSFRSFCESFIKIQHQEPCQDSSCPPSLFLESWRSFRFLMNMELVSDDGYHPSEASLKVSSRSNIRNLVKTVRIIHNYVSDTHTNGHSALY